MRATRRTVAAMVVLAALVAAGCTPGGSSAAPAETTTVDLPPSYRFDPPAIVVSVGAMVTWTNRDHFTHSVQFVDDDLASAPLVMRPSASATFRFETPGTYRYVCHLHPQNMQGTVTVSP